MSQRGPGQPPDKDDRARARTPRLRRPPAATCPGPGCALGPAAGGGGSSALPPPPARPRFRPRQLTLPGSGPARHRARGASGAATRSMAGAVVSGAQVGVRGPQGRPAAAPPAAGNAPRPARPAPGIGSGCSRSAPRLPLRRCRSRSVGADFVSSRTAPRDAAQVSPPSPQRCPEAAEGKGWGAVPGVRSQRRRITERRAGQRCAAAAADVRRARPRGSRAARSQRHALRSEPRLLCPAGGPRERAEGVKSAKCLLFLLKPLMYVSVWLKRSWEIQHSLLTFTQRLVWLLKKILCESWWHLWWTWLKLELFSSPKEKEACLIFENGLLLNQGAAHLIASLIWSLFLCGIHVNMCVIWRQLIG